MFNKALNFCYKLSEKHNYFEEQAYKRHFGTLNNFLVGLIWFVLSLLCIIFCFGFPSGGDSHEQIITVILINAIYIKFMFYYLSIHRYISQDYGFYSEFYKKIFKFYVNFFYYIILFSWTYVTIITIIYIVKNVKINNILQVSSLLPFSWGILFYLNILIYTGFIIKTFFECFSSDKPQTNIESPYIRANYKYKKLMQIIT